MAFDNDLHTVLTMDASQWLRQANAVTREAKELTRELDTKLPASSRKARNAFSDLSNDLNYFKGNVGALASALTPVTGLLAGIAAVDVAIITAGARAVGKAAEFERLSRSLEAVEGSSKKAAQSMAKLRELAKGDGLGVEEAVRTYGGLRNAGVESDLAFRLVRELGNAVARSGGGPDVLQRVGVQFAQMANKPFLQGEELTTISEAGIPAYKFIKDIYGTTDTEELKKRGITAKQVLYDLAASMEKLERVTPGFATQLDNLKDSFDQAIIGIGQGIIRNLDFSGIANAFENANDIGLFAELGETVSRNLLGVFSDAFSIVDDPLIEFGAVIVEISGKLRNFHYNLIGLTEFFQNLNRVNPFSFSWIVEKAVPKDNGSSEGEQFKQRVYQSGWAKAKEQLREYDREHGTDLNSQFMAEIAGKSHEESYKIAKSYLARMTEASKKDAPAGEAPVENAISQSIVQVPRLLEQIRENTDPLKGLKDMLLGGGQRTQSVINQRNLGATSKLQQVVNLLAEVIREEGATTVRDLNRTGTFNPTRY